MKQPLIVLIMLVSLVASSGLAVSATIKHSLRGPIYGVAEVTAGLRHDPAVFGSEKRTHMGLKRR
jgi:hypothetical protein